MLSFDSNQFFFIQNKTESLTTSDILERSKVKKIQDNFGSGWVGPGLTPKKKWKIVPKQSYITTDSWGLYTKCILFVFTMLKILSHYDLNVLFMSVTGFHKKSLDSFVSSIQFVCRFWNFLTLQSPLVTMNVTKYGTRIEERWQMRLYLQFAGFYIHLLLPSKRRDPIKF